MGNIGLRNKANIKAGFRACGISPFDPDRVLRKLPPAKAPTEASRGFKISESLLEFLQQFKYKPRDESDKQQQPRKKLDVAPGKSVSLEEIVRVNETPTQKPKKTSSAKSTVEVETSSSEEDSDNDTTSDEDSSDEDMTAEEKMLNMPSIDEKPKLNDFVVVRLSCEDSKTTKFYVAKVLKAIGSVFTVTYLRQSQKVDNAFIFPDVEDGPWNIDHEKMVMILNAPMHRKGATKRQSSFLIFNCDLSFCQ